MIAGFSLFALVIAAFVLLTILMGVRQAPRAFTALAQAPNQRTFIVPMELASLAGTLSGIAAIAGSAQSEARAEEAARVRRAIVPDSSARAAGPA